MAAAVAAELIIAAVHPPYNSCLERWGVALGDAVIALGIVGEVIFGRKDAGIQTELRRRSNEMLAEVVKATAWRHISAEDRGKIIVELAGKIPDDIFIEHEQEAEAHTFAKEIAEIFRTLGARRVRRGVNHVMVGEDPLFGTYVAASPEAFAVVIQDAFRKGGVRMSIQPPQLASFMLRPAVAFSGAPVQQPPRAHIYVGYRPIPEE